MRRRRGWQTSQRSWGDLITLVTLLGELLAREGNEFVYPQQICKTCKVRTVCLNLEEGRRYRVISIRDIRHDCALHEDGFVRVVEVERAEIPTTMRKKAAIEGSTVSWERIDCGNMGCAEWWLCHPCGLSDGQKVKVVQVAEDIPCPEGYDLKKVVVQ